MTAAASVFIGDEITAAGFRLAGMSVETPAPDQTAAALARVRDTADVVYITAASARNVPDAVLREALHAVSPLFVIVPDIDQRVAPPDLSARILAVLGLA
jgi:vacuolar-type H+-ATPase subunit F/Vma7